MKNSYRLIFIKMLALFISLSIFNTLTAQSNDSVHGDTGSLTPKIGLNVGLTSFKAKSEIRSSFFGNISGSSGSKIGFYGGIFAEIPISQRFSIQPELAYIQKGASSDGATFTGTDNGFFDDDFEDGDDGSVTFHYVDFPLLLRYNVQTEGSVVPSFYAGPVVGYRLHISSSEGEIDSEIEEFYRRVSAGIIAGTSLAFDRFIIDFRYDHGIRNMIDSDSLFDFDNENEEFNELLEELFGDIEISNKFRGYFLGLRFFF